MSNATWRAEFRRFALLLGALIVVSFPLVVTGFTSFYIRDFAVFGYPLAFFHKASFLNGEFPLWNPFNFCGIPHFAQWNTMLLYPGSLFYLLLPLPWALSLFCLVHQFLAGLGMYRLSRALGSDHAGGTLAGLAYSFGGLTLTCLMWPNNIAALGLLPWVISSARSCILNGGKAIPTVALIGTAQMLSGAPEIILTTWIFILGIHLADFDSESPNNSTWTTRLRPTGRLLLAVLLIALLSAAQLLPFFELLNFAKRADAGSGSSWSASGSCWVNFLIPGYQGLRTDQGFIVNHFQKWTLSFYPGMLILLCAGLAFSRRNKLPLILGAIAFAGLALASGHYGTAYPCVAKLLPLELMRFPVKFVLFPVVALPLLAGIGWTRARAGSFPPRAVLTSIVIASAFFAIAVYLDQTSTAARPERSGKGIEAVIRGGFLFFSALVLFIANRPARWVTYAKRLVPFLLFADLITHMPGLTATVESTAYHIEDSSLPPPSSRIHVTLKAWSALHALDSADPVRTMEINLEGRTASMNLLRKEAKLGGFLSLTPPAARDVARITDRDDWRSVNETMADFLGVATLGRWADRVVWENRSSVKSLISSGQQPFFGTADEQLERMREDDFDPFSVVCLETATTELVDRGLGQANLQLTSFNSHEIRFTADCKSPSIAVIAQTWYPAWKARVNNGPVPIMKADLQFQAILLPSGASEVVLRYEDNAFRLGIAFSLLGAIFTALIWWRSSLRPADDDSPGVGESERLVAGKST
jgi:hypothetical protein